MDDVLIGAYAEAGRNLKRHDPAGRIGMGGGQGPSAVGGWDWWKLSQALDVMEAYYIGNNYEFMRSFNPDLIPIHCSFGKGNPTYPEVRELVNKVISGRVEDGQLDESNLTLKDIKVIADTFVRVIMGMFHERIEYPEMEVRSDEVIPLEKARRRRRAGGG